MNPNIEVALAEAITAAQLREATPKLGFYMSSLGQCPRKQVLERAGVPPTNPPDQRAQRKMWLGAMYGKAIATSLTACGYLDPAWTEKLVTYRSYRGKTDGYTTHIPCGAVVEIKTCDDDAVTKYPMPEHYAWQGLAYCVAMDTPNLLLFQVGKSQGLCRHQVLALDDKYRKKLDDQISWLDEQWAAYLVKRGLELPEGERDDDVLRWYDKINGVFRSVANRDRSLLLSRHSRVGGNPVRRTVDTRLRGCDSAGG